MTPSRSAGGGGRRVAFNEAQKAVAVEIALRYGGVTKEALAEIQQAIGKVTARSVRNWAQGAERKFPEKSDPEEIARQTLDNLFEEVAYAYLNHAKKAQVIADSKGKEAVTAAAIATDKMRLLRGLPTAIIDVLPGFLEAAEKGGVDPVAYLSESAARIRERISVN